MSEQNKIDEIKAELMALTPRPWGWSESVTTCSLGECRRLELWTTENEEMELTIDDYKFAAKSPEYITYLLQEIERKDEALNEIELILTDDTSTQAIEMNQVINRAREAL
jgi:hypothetical protein